jgi:hypothetical protein
MVKTPKWPLVALSLCLPVLALGGVLGWRESERRRLAACLPPGISLATSASTDAQPKTLGDRMLSFLGIAALPPDSPTVGEELQRVGARCQDGRLYTEAGEEIVFWDLHSPADYEPWMFEGKRVIAILGGP